MCCNGRMDFVDFVDVLFIKSIFITTDEMKKRPKTKRKKI